MTKITPQERLRIASEQMAGMQASGYFATGKHVELMVVSALETADALIKAAGVEVSEDDQVAKLQAFKDFVHGRLDEIGIPANPDGPHSKVGCRIGDRLDIVAKLVLPLLKII